MSILFEKDSNFNSLNHQIASKPAINPIGMDENHHITPKPTIEYTRMDETYENSAPRPTTSKGPREELLSQLALRLKGLIRHAVAEVKQMAQAFIELQAENNEVVRAMPLSCYIPGDYDPSVLSMSERKRQKAVLVGETETSFDTHEDYALYGSELDKLPVLPHLLAQINPGVERDVGLKFLERIKGWKLQCKQRFDGKLDVYFYHLHSNEFFRSKTEVVNFILYEICPRHLRRATKAPNENFMGGNSDGAVPKRFWISSCSHSNSGQSTNKHSTIGDHEVEETATQEIFKTSNNIDTMNKINNEKSPLKHMFDTMNKINNEKSPLKHMNATEASTASSEATVEDFFHLEDTQGTKRRRTEYSSSATSRRVVKNVALSPDGVKIPSVDVVLDGNVEVQDKTVSASEPDQPEDIPKPSNNPYQYDLAIHLVNLKYRKVDYDDFF